MALPPPSASRRIVQVCPASGGVRDYAKVLDARFAEMGFNHVTIIGSKAEHRLLTPPNFQFHPDDVLLLNFSVYDYDRRGLCFWLLKALRDLRQTQRIGSIATFFHELDDDSPPWRRGFYQSFGQKYLCYFIQALSDRVMTNSSFHADRLQRFYFGRERALIMPVYSTVGEPRKLTPSSQRQSKAVIFGLEHNRRRGLLAFGGPEGIRRLPVAEVVEIGTGASVARGVSGWRFLGELPEQEVSRHMLESQFGLVTHRRRNLTKSTVFSAYAAHGCIPIIPPVPGGEPLSDGLVSGSNVILLADLPNLRQDGLPAMSQAIHQWYLAHDSQQAARTIVDAMAELLASPVGSAA